jgi:uncharacterized protein (TIGR02466 family)
MKLTIQQALEQASKALSENKFIEAKKIYRSILQTQPDNLDANNNLGIILHNNKDYSEAINHFKKTISIDSNFFLAYSNLGLSLKSLGKFKEAKKIFIQAINIEPNYSQAHNNLGVIFELLNNPDEAKISIKKAIEIDPYNPEFHFNLGNVLVKTNDFDNAILSYNKSIELKPNHKQALFNRGQIYFKKGFFDLSLKDFDNCDTKKSRPLSLASMYALNRIEDIFNRIKTYSKFDNTNLRLAAFSSFICNKEGRNTNYNFCKNPLDFIKISNLSTHIENYRLFNNKLIKQIKTIKSFWEPLNKTTIKGFQSKHNLFYNPKGTLEDLKSLILTEIEIFRLKFKNKNCDFIKKWPIKKNISCWYVILKQQGYQNPHIHPDGWLSGVVYLKVLSDLEKNEGAIEFSLNGEHYSDPDSPKIVYQPKIGDIVLFPSSLYHRTIPFYKDIDRISIAFDLIPEL